MASSVDLVTCPYVTKSSGLAKTNPMKQWRPKAMINGDDGLFVGWLVAYCPSNRRVYLRDGSAQTILRAATLR